MPFIIQIINIISGIAFIMKGTFCIFLSKVDKQKAAEILTHVREKMDTLFLSRDDVRHEH